LHEILLEATEMSRIEFECDEFMTRKIFIFFLNFFEARSDRAMMYESDEIDDYTKNIDKSLIEY
jgi:hypothetical protein